MGAGRLTARVVRTTLHRGLPRLAVGRSVHADMLAHAHAAVVLSCPAAARRQPSIRVLAKRKRGQDHGQAKDGEQQDGDQSAQRFYSSTLGAARQIICFPEGRKAREESYGAALAVVPAVAGHMHS